MNASKRSRTVIWAVVISVAAALLMCCRIPAGLIDRYVLLHIHSYEQPAPDSIGNVAITVDVNPQERIQEPPERLIGPPYALSVMLRDPTRSAIEAEPTWTSPITGSIVIPYQSQPTASHGARLRSSRTPSVMPASSNVSRTTASAGVAMPPLAYG